MFPPALVPTMLLVFSLGGFRRGFGLNSSISIQTVALLYYTRSTQVTLRRRCSAPHSGFPPLRWYPGPRLQASALHSQHPGSGASVTWGVGARPLLRPGCSITHKRWFISAVVVRRSSHTPVCTNIACFMAEMSVLRRSIFPSRQETSRLLKVTGGRSSK